jgi:hypothetical protein
MARKYLGGSGEALTVWISVAASTVLVFYGYDQVCPTSLLLPILDSTITILASESFDPLQKISI